MRRTSFISRLTVCLLLLASTFSLFMFLLPSPKAFAQKAAVSVQASGQASQNKLQGYVSQKDMLSQIDGDCRQYGLVCALRDGKVVVDNVIPESQAAGQGVLAGDIVVNAEPKGALLYLTVQRNKEEISLKIERSSLSKAIPKVDTSSGFPKYGKVELARAFGIGGGYFKVWTNFYLNCKTCQQNKQNYSQPLFLLYPLKDNQGFFDQMSSLPVDKAYQSFYAYVLWSRLVGESIEFLWELEMWPEQMKASPSRQVLINHIDMLGKLIVNPNADRGYFSIEARRLFDFYVGKYSGEEIEKSAQETQKMLNSINLVLSQMKKMAAEKGVKLGQMPDNIFSANSLSAFDPLSPEERTRMKAAKTWTEFTAVYNEAIERLCQRPDRLKLRVSFVLDRRSNQRVAVVKVLSSSLSDEMKEEFLNRVEAAMTQLCPLFPSTLASSKSLTCIISLK